MSDPEGKVYDPPEIYGMDYSMGVLVRLLSEEEWIEKRLKEIKNQIAHCKTHIAMLEKYPHLAEG